MNFLKFQEIHEFNRTLPSLLHIFLKLTGGTLSTFSDLHTISTGAFTINLVASHNQSDWMMIHLVT